MHTRHTLTPILVLLAGGIAIGFSPIFVRLSDLGPVTTAFYRLALALPALLLMYRLMPVRNTQDTLSHSSDAALFLLAGIAFALDIMCWHWSITLTSVANATLFANMAPVFVVLGSWLVWRIVPGPRFLLALLIGLSGVTILMQTGPSPGTEHLVGDLLGIVTAFFYAIYILAVSHLRTRHSAMSIMLRTTLISAVIVLPVAWLSEDSFWFVSINGFLVLLMLGVLSHAGGQGLITWALAHLSASFSSLALLIQPVVAAILAWLLFAETMTPGQLLGALLVLAAIPLASRSARRIPDET